jgi:hypothetical protein
MTCSYCNVQMTNDDVSQGNVITLPKCLHTFHLICLADHFFHGKIKCPIPACHSQVFKPTMNWYSGPVIMTVIILYILCYRIENIGSLNFSLLFKYIIDGFALLGSPIQVSIYNLLFRHDIVHWILLFIHFVQLRSLQYCLPVYMGLLFLILVIKIPFVLTEFLLQFF